MRLATYEAADGGGARLGLVLGPRIVDVAAAARSMGQGEVPDNLLAFITHGARAQTTARGIAERFGGDTAAGDEVASVRLLAPIPRPRRNVVCVGLNYTEHVAESKSVAGSEAPAYPVFFSKPPSTVIGTGAEIPWHGSVSTAIDWEVELAVIIGREGRDIAEDEAMGYVFGYTVANDVTARDLQGRHGQWYKGKGLDGFCPLGPWVVTADEIGDPHELDITLRVNGVEKQRSNTRHLIFHIPRLIAEWSAGMTLYPGDILLTGTPSGVGIGRKPPEFLKPGDEVEAEIPAIGVLRNVVGR
ncbi:MAG TPA: fumarylacetoacetate hydrolase family protein [Dehalococcoidia bacterium]|nr:fumarylacetoacetate hydrolase family protein [Dehalococcoidia bacterium]